MREYTALQWLPLRLCTRQLSLGKKVLKLAAIPSLSRNEKARGLRLHICLYSWFDCRTCQHIAPCHKPHAMPGQGRMLRDGECKIPVRLQCGKRSTRQPPMDMPPTPAGIYLLCLHYKLSPMHQTIAAGLSSRSECPSARACPWQAVNGLKRRFTNRPIRSIILLD